ncbi:hypothetical protein H310_09712 [Aphanomyces invadans]|uniref:Uncharacterized protein n=1 Tax=Aphanomyces invadans TaxID=157072 RepID=A0A024TTB5_9STRA|nr:hypothetical protein H310_09712 [Aphanomyces invadans]ETV97375.1 hypothetical protein H310_09712 [Aphanomyces invadans]|eukprot:XP_008874083.1 hypothetical protein H310_09712 [Aphanomyces invadans]
MARDFTGIFGVNQICFVRGKVGMVENSCVVVVLGMLRSRIQKGCSISFLDGVPCTKGGGHHLLPGVFRSMNGSVLRTCPRAYRCRKDAAPATGDGTGQSV